MPQTITAHTLHTADGSLDYPVITVEDGRILEVTSGPPCASEDVLTPTFLDIHVHGALGHDFMLASLPEMQAVGRFLAARGVGHYLPTTVTSDVEVTLRALATLATFLGQATPDDAARPLGLHLEGPFLCPAKRGVHPLDHLLPPSIENFDRFQQAAQGTIRLLTLAPEMPGALDLIAYAVAQGVRVSLGHSNATAAETEAAIRAGASSATHIFNAMRTLDHREPGLVGAVLDSDQLFAECIVDGVHVHPAMVRLWFKMKGERRAILVTDGMSATGMPDGTYRLGDLVVEMHNGICLSDGVLAGSVLTLDKAVSNFCHFTGASLATGTRLASRNPAEMLGLAEKLAFAPGSPANFNVYDRSGERRGCILNGRRLPL
ncbi:MAG: N-acetylglucosamine-6-phosphate deacetylase [Janthinobacterium lividum]